MKELDEMTAQERKDCPVFSGVMKYFPNALIEVAHVSKVGNDQHNPGEPLHWAMEKSTDEADALVRHQLKAGQRDKDGERHSAKVAWRALAQLEREILAERQMMFEAAKEITIRPSGNAGLQGAAALGRAATKSVLRDKLDEYEERIDTPLTYRP